MSKIKLRENGVECSIAWLFHYRIANLNDAGLPKFLQKYAGTARHLHWYGSAWGPVLQRGLQPTVSTSAECEISTDK